MPIYVNVLDWICFSAFAQIRNITHDYIYFDVDLIKLFIWNKNESANDQSVKEENNFKDDI